jgi:hypothetical protein
MIGGAGHPGSNFGSHHLRQKEAGKRAMVIRRLRNEESMPLSSNLPGLPFERFSRYFP